MEYEETWKKKDIVKQRAERREKKISERKSSNEKESRIDTFHETAAGTVAQYHILFHAVQPVF